LIIAKGGGGGTNPGGGNGSAGAATGGAATGAGLDCANGCPKPAKVARRALASGTVAGAVGGAAVSVLADPLVAFCIIGPLEGVAIDATAPTTVVSTENKMASLFPVKSKSVGYSDLPPNTS